MEALCYGVLIGVLSVVSWVDIRTRRIPNTFIIALMVLRVGFLVASEMGVLYQPLWGAEAFLVGILVAVGVMAFLMVSAWCSGKIWRRESLGMGDVKLIGACCLFLDFEGACVMLVGAALLGCLFAVGFLLVKKDSTFPFAPAISLGCCIAWFV